jgi:hypothetical protein
LVKQQRAACMRNAQLARIQPQKPLEIVSAHANI